MEMLAIFESFIGNHYTCKDFIVCVTDILVRSKSRISGGKF